MKYLLNQTLSVHPAMADSWRGNPIEGEEFQYLHDPFRPLWSSVARMIFTSNPRAGEKKADNQAPPVSQYTDYLADRSRDWIVWLGHASYLMQLNDLRLLTDPQLTDMPFIPLSVFISYAASTTSC